MSNADFPLVAVVTGAGSGIGKATAIELGRRGCRVLLHTRRNIQGLMKTASECRGGRTVVADLKNDTSLYSFVNAAFAWFGYVDLWVHAAGADVLTGSAKDWSFDRKLSELWEMDIRAMMLLSRMVAQRQVQQEVVQGRLPSMVHIGWDQAFQGMEGDSGQYFCAIKAAVSAFSKSLAKSYAPHLRVNCIEPGWIQTEWGQQTSNAWSERATGESLLDRWGKPEDVARLIAAISLGDGEFLNGQSLKLNGGWRGGEPVIKCATTEDGISPIHHSRHGPMQTRLSND